MRVSFLVLSFVGGALLIYTNVFNTKPALVHSLAPVAEVAQRLPLPSDSEDKPIKAAAKSSVPLKNLKENTPKIYSRNAGPGWEPNAEQKLSLEEAKRTEQDWEKQRTNFLEVELRLSEKENSDLSKMRTKASVLESALVSEAGENEADEEARAMTLKNNRIEYEKQLLSLLGQQRYESYLGFYKLQWKTSGAGLHLPLK